MTTKQVKHIVESVVKISEIFTQSDSLTPIYRKWEEERNGVWWKKHADFPVFWWIQEANIEAGDPKIAVFLANMGRPIPYSIGKSRSTPPITEGLGGGEAGRLRSGAMQDKP